MQCVTPMFREYIEYSPEQKKIMKEQGIKQWQKIVPRKEVMEYLLENPYAIRELDDINESFINSGSSHRIQRIPCHNCYACKLNYSKDWAIRCICECLESPGNNYWLTLTYDEEHLPIAEFITYKKYAKKGREYTWETIENTGEVTWFEGNLVPEHINTFLNSLRKYYERKGHTGIKYFYCGEYGSENHRPHYHMILFNCPLNPLDFYDNDIDQEYHASWRSHEIDKYWNKGFVRISEIEFANAAYTARYSMKKLIDGSKTEEYYAEQGKIKEFIRMSRMPGIGTRYYEKHKEHIYENDEMYLRTVKGITEKAKPPAAWDRRLEKENPELYDMIKESRKLAAERAQKLEYEISTYSDLERLKMKAEKITIKGNMLKRDL